MQTRTASTHLVDGARRGRWPRYWYAALLAALLGVLTALPVPASGSGADHSERPVFAFGNPNPVGSSHVVRTDRGVSVTLETSDLEPGHAVTLWLVAANDPDECENGTPLSRCGEQDHLEGLGEISVHNLTGHVIGDEGDTAEFGGHLRVGDRRHVLFEGDPGLTAPRNAEILLILKTHGPKKPGITNEMISTFAAGCETPQFPPSLDPREDMVGTTLPEEDANDCAEIQISVHTP